MVVAGGPLIEWQHDRIVTLDQRLLPGEVRELSLTTVDGLVEAIVSLAIRGAPMLGAAGAFGVVLAGRQAERESWDAARLDAEIDRIRRARPTAVNLASGVAAVLPALREGVTQAEARAQREVGLIASANRQIAERGADFLAALGDAPLRVHTHCNAGALACVQWGTALGVVQVLHERNRLANVIVDETRPLLQGSRLTCWELAGLGIDHQLISDGAGPFVIAQGLADAVVVGADRIAANGDVANKIGTFGLALAAQHMGIPFIVAAPESTIDPATPTGACIPVEQRPGHEVTHIGDIQMAPKDTPALNFAFDITPFSLVTAIVTEDRVIARDAGDVPSGAGEG